LVDSLLAQLSLLQLCGTQAKNTYAFVVHEKSGIARKLASADKKNNEVCVIPPVLEIG
jgi:hypothetical protein